VTTWPVLKLPLHMSYLHALGARSDALALHYLRLGLTLCRRAGIQPSFLLHPTDFLGAEDAPALGFFPGMQRSAASKLALVERVLDELRARYAIGPVGEHARRVEGTALQTVSAPALAPATDRRQEADQ